MFIIDGTGESDPAAIAQLVRLMLNIESGKKVYDWGVGSDSTPLVQPEPRFLTMQIPAPSTGGHPMTLELKPSVGIIYYQMTPGWSENYKLRTDKDLSKFAKQLSTIFAEYSYDHLEQDLPVDTLPHGSFRQKGRIVCGTKIVESLFMPAPQEDKFAETFTLPARCIYVLTRPGVRVELPSHISYLAAFTWYIRPIISGLSSSSHFYSTSEVNAVLSSIFFDTAVSHQPFHEITTREVFGVNPLRRGSRPRISSVIHRC